MTTDFANAHSTDAHMIPVIDVSGAITDDNFEGVADAIHAAAIDHRFFYISNHGIDPALMDQAFAVSEAFFNLPEKDKVAVAVDTHQRGWLAQWMALDHSSPQAIVEQSFRTSHLKGKNTTKQGQFVYFCYGRNSRA